MFLEIEKAAKMAARYPLIFITHFQKWERNLIIFLRIFICNEEFLWMGDLLINLVRKFQVNRFTLLLSIIFNFIDFFKHKISILFSMKHYITAIYTIWDTIYI